MVATGVRSSWEASATNWRKRASDAERRSKASSIRPSIPLRATPRSPASVPAAPSGTRCERSPAAMAPAVTVIRCTGRTPRRITHQVTRPSTASTASTAAASTAIRRRTASSTPSSGRASTTVAPVRRSMRACMR